MVEVAYSPTDYIGTHPSCVNVSEDELQTNMRAAIATQLPTLCELPTNEQRAAIVGGGPSTQDCLWDLWSQQAAGHYIVAINGAGAYLHSKGITPDALIILDAREHNAKYLDGIPNTVLLYLASQVHPAVFAKATERGFRVVVWHAAHAILSPKTDGNPIGGAVAEYVPYLPDGITEPGKPAMIGGGTTAGMLSISLMCVRGHRHLDLYGFDSSYRGKDGHPYPQAENDGDEPVEIIVGGQRYLSPQWMSTQAAQFPAIASSVWERFHAIIEVHGDGLLPAMAAEMVRMQAQAALGEMA